MTETSNANFLINEKSPYLQQHARNPVQWYPWGEEALTKAVQEQKPIFLSIGYSTCHWCHVMEQESFENEEIAQFLNNHFVSIKVDREERPDIDHIYMEFVQATSGSGGWPLSAFLTPEQKPFYGGTYFPPQDKWGKPGFLSLLKQLQKLWQDQKENVLAYSNQFAYEPEMVEEEKRSWNKDNLQNLWQQVEGEFSSRYDERYGGFSSAPKFPQAYQLSFLLRLAHANQKESVKQMVFKTLTAMTSGGIYDHLGFGICRYATDTRWHVPHFEKMLYDQAFLVRALSEAYQLTNEIYYQKKVDEILTYVTTQLAHPEGAFFSAEDADSFPEEHSLHKKEGAFYTWSWEELAQSLSKEELELAANAYGLKPEGNVQDDPHEEFVGLNILHCTTPVPGQKKAELEKIRTTLLAIRSKRPRPGLDHKVLADWNALMISAMAYAARVFQRSDWLDIAAKAEQFIWTKMRQGQRLWHRYCQGELAVKAFLEDYAFLIHAELELHQATGRPQYLKKAIELSQEQRELFLNSQQNEFYMTGHDASRLIKRPKNKWDGAIPSGNAVSLENFVRLNQVCPHPQYEHISNQLGRTYFKQMNEYPLGSVMFLTGLYAMTQPMKTVIIAQSKDNLLSNEIEWLQQCYAPQLTLSVIPREEQALQELLQMRPELKDYCRDTAQFYACENGVCYAPTDSLEKVKEILGL